MRVVEGVYLNIVVILTCFVASVMLSLLINVFKIYIYLYVAIIVKCVVLIFMNVLYKIPLLLLLLKV